ncbi:hypothetical protein HanRHA438_Chr03g0098011 [Helianthus annuus]|nr:hypothetical protein HanRHA438_Chr03g0098011 [Helianthus annuus]
MEDMMLNQAVLLYRIPSPYRGNKLKVFTFASIFLNLIKSPIAFTGAPNLERRF